MNLLVLGGTHFIGRRLVATALADGHHVTLFNRGTNPSVLPEVTRLVGDRNGDLGALATGEWDAVFDFSGFRPEAVSKTATLLRDRVGHYTFMSSIAVYRDKHLPGVDEDGRLMEMPPDPPAGFSWDTYGPFKVLCERVVAETFPGRWSAIRAGFVSGPGDPGPDLVDWGRAMAQDDVVGCRADPQQAVQVVDVRDLADFLLLTATKPLTGPFTVAGPPEPLTFATMLETCRAVTGGHATVDWTGDRTGFIVQPKDGSHDGTFRLSFARALAAGLRLRPFAETARDTLADLTR